MKNGGNDHIAGKRYPFFPFTGRSGVAGFPSFDPCVGFDVGMLLEASGDGLLVIDMMSVVIICKSGG